MKKMVILATVVCVLAFGFTGFSSTANVENQSVEFDAELPTRPLVEKPKEEPKIEIPSIEVPKETPKETPKEEPTVPSTEEEPKETPKESEPTRHYNLVPPSSDGVTGRKAIVPEKETQVNVTEEVPQEIPVVENDPQPQPVPVVENAIPRTGDTSGMIVKIIGGLVIASFIMGNVMRKKNA
jgi:chromosome undetermined scaffold_104, whole genome shotgun sequence